MAGLLKHCNAKTMQLHANAWNQTLSWAFSPDCWLELRAMASAGAHSECWRFSVRMQTMLISYCRSQTQQSNTRCWSRFEDNTFFTFHLVKYLNRRCAKVCTCAGIAHSLSLTSLSVPLFGAELPLQISDNADLWQCRSQTMLISNCGPQAMSNLYKTTLSHHSKLRTRPLWLSSCQSNRHWTQQIMSKVSPNYLSRALDASALTSSPASVLSLLSWASRLDLARSRSFKSHCKSSSSITFAARMILLFFCICSFRFRLIALRSCFSLTRWAFSKSTSWRTTLFFRRRVGAAAAAATMVQRQTKRCLRVWDA